MRRSPNSLTPVVICVFITLAVIGFAEVSAQEESVESIAVPALRDLNSYFPFAVPENLDAWTARKSQLQKHLRVSLGLWPYPMRTPLNAVIHGTIDQGEYTIKKVYFESLPGFFVTGNLYEPKSFLGSIPGIITPHGHFPQGRFGEQSDKAIQGDLDSGAETFRSNAKNKIQTRCANLAKMGCIVFEYDMIGYADNQQISYEVAHRFSKQRPDVTGPESWGLFSPQAELNLQNVMGLQAWNSIRALDFLETIPGVDKNRIGVTGASGGGTQTFIVCALDDRPAAAFPAVMVSTAMQGGCTCENCCYLRIGTGNVEIAAMFAPKPLALTAANDWTKEMATKGFPELQKLYQLYGKLDNVELNARIDFGHNYNQVSREAMYRWFKQHLEFSGEPVETEIEFLKPQNLTVFDDNHERPSGGENFERNLLVGMASPKIRGQNRRIDQVLNRLLDDPDIRKNLESSHGTTDRQGLFRVLHANWEQTPDKLKNEFLSRKFSFQEIENHVGTFVDVVMTAAEKSNGLPLAVKSEKADSDREGFEAAQWNFSTTNSLPESSVREISNGTVPHVLLISKDGFSVLQKDHALHSFVRTCLDSMSVSVFNNGWITDADAKQTRRVNNPRESLAYTVGYNAPQLARRANAWLAATEMTTSADSAQKNSVYVVSLDQAGREVALNARELKTRDEVNGLVINTRGFRFSSITDIRDPDLLPGALKYGDLPGLLSLAAPKPMLLIGEDKYSASAVVKAYELSGAPENLTLIDTIPRNQTEQEVVLKWINDRESKKSKHP